MIREVPGAGAVAAARCTAHDYRDPGKPRIAWNDEQTRADPVDALVGDALRLLGHLPEQPLGERAANAVGLLALVAGQDVEPADGSDGRDGRRRITRGTAPDRVVSTVDPETRHIHKTRTHRQDGYKAHLAVEPETTICTDVELTPGSGEEHHEAAVALDLLAEEEQPVEAFGDTACSTGTARHVLGGAGHRLFFKPVPQRPAVAGGFVLDDFRIDTIAGTATCPAVHTVPLSPDRGLALARTANFGRHCTGCPLRERRTTSQTGRNLRIQPGYDLRRTARRQAAEPAWQDAYRRWRPPVERAVAWLVGHGNRRLRYRGTIKNNAWLHIRGAALNLRTLTNLGLTHNGHRLADRGCRLMTAAPITPRSSSAFY